MSVKVEGLRSYVDQDDRTVLDVIIDEPVLTCNITFMINADNVMDWDASMARDLIDRINYALELGRSKLHNLLHTTNDALLMELVKGPQHG